MEATRITKEELDKIQNLNRNIVKAKVAIAEAELDKSMMMRAVEQMRREIGEIDNKLKEKYGEDAVIDMNTGELTKK